MNVLSFPLKWKMSWEIKQIILYGIAYFNLSPRCLSFLGSLWFPHFPYLANPLLSWFSVWLFILVSAYLLYDSRSQESAIQQDALFHQSIKTSLLLCAAFFWFDMVWLICTLDQTQTSMEAFNSLFSLYLSKEKGIYLLLGLYSSLLLVLRSPRPKAVIQPQSISDSVSHLGILAIQMLLWIAAGLFLPGFHAIHFAQSEALQFENLPSMMVLLLNSGAALGLGALIDPTRRHPTLQEDGFSLELRLLRLLACAAVILIWAQLGLELWPLSLETQRNGLSFMETLLSVDETLLKTFALSAPFGCLLLFALYQRHALKRQRFDTQGANSTSGYFGTAAWATSFDYHRLNFYDPNNGYLMGQDLQGNDLYLPLYNKLTIAPPGSGKTTASSLLMLLSYNGPIFATDFKSGELWWVAAHYRSEVLRRKVVALDPYRVLDRFSSSRPSGLDVHYQFNPFDFIPEDEYERDRMINAFAASFIITEEGQHAQHFDENARILIRGFIDYMMKALPPEARNLETLYSLLSEHQSQAKMTFESMARLSGRAAAASNQVGRVGDNERGSILSTSYRQIDWMSDLNMQRLLSHSNFDLRDFLKGNMDIFVILPEEQVKEQSRLVRMLLALLKALMTQANPEELPQNKMLFLLEELAQLGYCPDVEQFVEVMRARGVVVWTVFQSLSQIECYQKPDLFLGATIKQIFTLDDTKTMEWIQKLGGKRTVVTKTHSSQSGDSHQKMQVFGGTISKGEGESFQETGVDLIALNEIREMPLDEQLIFMHGAKPMRCKKVRYFEHPFFKERYGGNLLG